ncbi:hypothetical protein CANINC_001764 [Pichia inconspicua]|uniref:DUF985 domain-containing protein n=1 Tax=Pichia inconspicua TaxID=52247 RepID=A0A4T0X391_9ASCO|nr:hypothetical protein CANINC_001764 [[Candida] inconspicua]
MLLILEPQYKNRGICKESDLVVELATNLQLDKHPNGGYFKETDRPGERVLARQINLSTGSLTNYPIKRNASSLIHFLMTCESPIGKFHTNVTSRTIHILQKGSGIYVLIKPNGDIESFKVGFKKGERTQWVVEPGTFKGCYLIPESGIGSESNSDCMLVSEVVVPGFDFEDMVFLNKEKLIEKIGEKEAESLQFLL